MALMKQTQGKIQEVVDISETDSLGAFKNMHLFCILVGSLTPWRHSLFCLCLWVMKLVSRHHNRAIQLGNSWRLRRTNTETTERFRGLLQNSLAESLSRHGTLKTIGGLCMPLSLTSLLSTTMEAGPVMLTLKIGVRRYDQLWRMKNVFNCIYCRLSASYILFSFGPRLKKMNVTKHQKFLTFHDITSTPWWILHIERAGVPWFDANSGFDRSKAEFSVNHLSYTLPKMSKGMI